MRRNRRAPGRLALLAAIGATLAAAGAASAAPSLLEPDPLGYDLGTIRRLGPAIVSLPDLIATEASAAIVRGRAVGMASSALIVLLFVVIGWVLFGQRRLARAVEARSTAVAARMPAAARPWSAAVFQVIAAAAPPFLLWLAHDAVRRATGFTGTGFLLAGTLLAAWARYALVVAALRELLLRPLLPLPAEHRQYLWMIGRGLAVYGLLLYALAEVAARAGVAPDMIALLGSLFDLGLIIVLTAVATRKAAFLALLPDLPNPVYRSFVSGLRHSYGIVLALTTATALAAWAGYARLAEFVWIRTWALAGLFVGVIVALHLAHMALRRWIVGREEAPEAAERLVLSTARLLDYVALLVALRAAVVLTGVAGPLGAFLARPLYTLVDRQVSLQMLLQAALVVGVFAFLSRPIRDFLDFQVYPALGVDEGIGHAVNTFIAYSMGVVGLLFALEYVGLGLGALTVFAGALGIGLGFGMQSLANNLSSGITLVFGRSLRKGDWVTVGDTIGVVEEVGMRATSVRTRDAIEYLVPNADFVTGTIVNWTRSSPLVREHLPVGVAYGSDPERVHDLLLEVAAATTHVQPAPAPEVWFTGFGASSLEFELLVWVNVKDTAWAKIRSDLYFAIFRRFAAADIGIPFPQRDLHLRSISPEILAAVSEPVPLTRAARELLRRASGSAV